MDAARGGRAADGARRWRRSPAARSRGRAVGLPTAAGGGPPSRVAFVAVVFAAAAIFFGIFPSPLFNFAAHAGHAHLRPVLSRRECPRYRTRMSGSEASVAASPEAADASLRSAARGVPGRELHRARARAPARALHEPRPAGVRAGQPARDGQGRAVRALLALPRHAPAAVPRRVRRPTSASARGAGTARRARGRPSCTSGSSSATAMTRSRSSAARTSPASGSRTCSRRSSSARGSAPTSSSRRATSPTTRRCPTPPGGYRYYRDPELGPQYAAAMDELFTIYSRALPRVAAWAEEEFPRAAGRARRPRTRARSRPRRSTCCAGCCPRARCRTWGSSPPARPTSS